MFSANAERPGSPTSESSRSRGSTYSRTMEYRPSNPNNYVRRQTSYDQHNRSNSPRPRGSSVPSANSATALAQDPQAIASLTIAQLLENPLAMEMHRDLMEMQRDLREGNSQVRNTLAEIVRLNGEVAELRQTQATTQYAFQKYSDTFTKSVSHYQGFQAGLYQL